MASKPVSLETAESNVRSAALGVSKARAATALQVSGSLQEREVRIDLRTLGINLPVFPLTNPPQYSDVIGPIGVFDPRLKAVKILIDRSAKRSIEAAHSQQAEAADALAEDRERVAATVAHEYLLALRTSKLVELARQELGMDETLRGLAEERVRQTLAPQSELRNARMKVNVQRQQLSGAEADQRRALLRLLYLIGGRLDGTLTLIDSLMEKPSALTEADAIAKALRLNPQLAMLRKHVQTLQLRDAAARAERLPVLATSGDAGLNVVTPDPSGTGVASKSFTYNAELELRIPILDGHRRELERADLASQMQEQTARERGLRREIEFETRLAFVGLHQSSNAVDIARKDLNDEDATLREVEEKHRSGTASGLEVKQAETERARAEDVLTAALFAQEEARLALDEAIGDVPHWIGKEGAPVD